ncbi:MAG: hypothetical protein LUF00_11305 [Lachnospiraceae bacterium]|nr:hypothetical protein [Lachnospiraceae bacterium]
MKIYPWNVKWFDENGKEITHINIVAIERNKETKSYIRSYRKALELFVKEFDGYIPDAEREVEQIVESHIKRISKSCPTYMAKDINYGNEKDKKRLKKALSKYALKVCQDDVVGFIDTSLMNNGGDGLLFSKEGIAFDYAFEKVFLHYSEIDRMSFNKKHKQLVFHGDFVEREDDRINPSINDIYYNLDELKKCIEQIQYVI